MTKLHTSHYRTITWREGEGQSLKIVSAKLSSPTEIKPMSRYDLVKFPKVYSADRLIYNPQQRLFYILQVKYNKHFLFTVLKTFNSFTTIKLNAITIVFSNNQRQIRITKALRSSFFCNFNLFHRKYLKKSY